MTSQTETPDIVTMLQTAINDRGKGSVWGYAGLLEDATAEIERLRSELAKHQWRTMESAPRDGTPVLVWFRGRLHVAEFVSVWHPENKHWVVRNPAVGHEDESRLVEQIDPPTLDGKPIPGMWTGPTHWQPLPSPPGENDGC